MKTGVPGTNLSSRQGVVYRLRTEQRACHDQPAVRELDRSAWERTAHWGDLGSADPPMPYHRVQRGKLSSQGRQETTVDSKASRSCRPVGLSEEKVESLTMCLGDQSPKPPGIYRFEVQSCTGGGEDGPVFAWLPSKSTRGLLRDPAVQLRTTKRRSGCFPALPYPPLGQTHCRSDRQRIQSGGRTQQT